ncbi:META domain-containing protein [Vibrio sp.]|nr:META domain-containing protein [Vibrio sp.]
MIRKIGIGFLVSLVVGCSSTDVEPLTLTQQEWRLERINNKEISIQSTLHIDENDRATGLAGCNRFFGTAKHDDDSFKLGPMGATRKMCITKEEQMVERRVLQAFQLGAEYTIQGDTLTVTAQNTFVYVVVTP